MIDAKILIRAELGKRVRSLIETYEDSVGFYTPDVCFDDAWKYIPQLLASRGGLSTTLSIGIFEQLARERMARAELYPRGSH